MRDALVEMFRVNSLQIKYQDSPFTSARCRACLEKLEFNIIIWQSREENKILIEVDRISGDSIPFHTKYANLVLKTVEDCCSGNKSYSPEPTQIQDPITRGTSERDKIQLEQTSSILNRCKGEQTYIEFVGKENPMVSAIEIVADMLCAARYDSRGLALESLLHLTDPYLSDLETVKAVSKVILLGTAPGFVDNDVQICRIIQERVVYLAVTGLCFDGVYAEDELQDHAFCALNILAQAINNDDTASDLTAFVSYSRTIISGQGRTNVVDGLLRMVSCANSAPHRAYLAAHILEVLCRRITEVNSQIQPHAGDIQRAHRIGTMSHAGLEQASKRLLDAMCVC